MLEFFSVLSACVTPSYMSSPIVCADDSSRVTLSPISNVEGSDYINACTLDVSELGYNILGYLGYNI